MIHNSISKVLLIGLIIFLVGCDVTTKEEIIENQTQIINEDLIEKTEVKYLKSIDSIELMDNQQLRELGLRDSDDLNHYSAEVTFNNSVNYLTDMEIQEVFEELPLNSSFINNRWYDDNADIHYFKLSLIRLVVNNDMYEISENGIIKNSENFDPKSDFIAEMRRTEQNKRYDVRIRISGKYYSIRNATKSEITSRYVEIFNNNKSRSSSHPQIGPKRKSYKTAPPLNWRKDVTIIREYE